MRPVPILLSLSLILIVAGLVSRLPTVQAQTGSSAPIRLIHVTSDTAGNMVDAASGTRIIGSVKGIGCPAPRDCWVALQ